MKVLKGILLQISVVCSFVCIITKILDWYNPYMDFSGHTWYIQICLYGSVVTMALITKYGNPAYGRGKKYDKKHI